MSPTLSLTLAQVDKLPANDLQILERAVQARQRLLAARPPQRPTVSPQAARETLQRQANLFDRVWDS